MVADRIAEGRAAPMRSPAVNTGYGQEWIRYGQEWIRGLAASKLWQLSKVAMAAAIERRDGPAFARALEWHLAARRVYASMPPFMFGSSDAAATVRVTAEALRADGGGELAIALEAAIRRAGSVVHESAWRGVAAVVRSADEVAGRKLGYPLGRALLATAAGDPCPCWSPVPGADG